VLNEALTQVRGINGSKGSFCQAVRFGLAHGPDTSLRSTAGHP
jgi:hypothetical protein